jgi:NADH dehydrogenase/NADH:ubiquinone oxidoreductase subunit G
MRSLEKASEQLKPAAVAWEETVMWLDCFLKNLSGEEVQALLGKYCDLETITSLKNLSLSLGTGNLHLDSTEIDKRLIAFRNDFIFNLPLDFLLSYDNLFLIGLNGTQDAPIFNAASDNY